MSVFINLPKITIKITICLFFGIIKIPFEIAVKPAPRKKKKKNRFAKSAYRILEKGRVEMLKVRSRIGIKDDAFLTVVLVGFLRIFFEKLDETVIKAERIDSSLKPCFALNIFWLYLEGIVRIFPTQIIGIMVWKGRDK